MTTHLVEPTTTEDEATEPAPASNALPTSFTELVTEFPHWEDAPMTQVSCPHCLKTHYHNKMLATLFPDTPCDPCAESYNAQGSVYDSDPSLAPVQTLQALLAPLLPLALIDTDPAKIPPRLKPITDWAPNSKGIGLWITGDTRTFKSRSLALLIKKLAQDKHKITTFFHGAFHDDLLHCIRSSKSLRDWKRKITSIPILAIDDLFATKLTEHAESTIFEILDARIHSYLPTLVTTQITKTEAKRMFASNKRHEAFFARIKEYFTLVNSNPPQNKQTTL